VALYLRRSIAIFLTFDTFGILVAARGLGRAVPADRRTQTGTLEPVGGALPLIEGEPMRRLGFGS
jgi:hypothetical protein